MASPIGSQSENERRSFLKSAVNGIAAVLALGAAGVGIASLSPRGNAGRREEFLPVADEDEAPRRGAREFLYTYRREDREVSGRVILVQSPEGLLALSPSCTHLGCFVVWQEERGGFSCPCHGGRYDAAGINIEGPPPAPLTRFPLKVEGGKVLVRVPL